MTIPKIDFSASEALEELRVTAKISEEEGDTPALSYIRDLIEQLNRALREVTFGEDRCLKGARRGLSPREELGRSVGNVATATSVAARNTCSRNEASAPSLHRDYGKDDTTVDRCEIGTELLKEFYRRDNGFLLSTVNISSISRIDAN